MNGLLVFIEMKQKNIFFFEKRNSKWSTQKTSFSSSAKSLIILVGLTMTCFSEKMMISYSCISGSMPIAQLPQKIFNGIYRYV